MATTIKAYLSSSVKQVFYNGQQTHDSVHKIIKGSFQLHLVELLFQYFHCKQQPSTDCLIKCRLFVVKIRPLQQNNLTKKLRYGLLIQCILM